MIAVALSPVLVIAGWRTHLDNEHMKEDRQRELLLEASAAIDWLEESIVSAEAMLSIFRTDIVDDGCGRTLDRIGDELPYVLNIVRFGPSGVAQCSAHGQTGFPINDRHWHAQLRDGSERVRTDAFVGGATGRWTFATFLRTENADGEFTGSIAAGLDIERLLADMPSPDDESGIEVALVDRDGSIFGSERFERGYSTELQDAVMSGEAVLDVIRGPDGISFDRVVQRVGGGGTYAMVTRRSPGLSSEFTLRPATTIGLPVATFLLVLVCVWFAIERLILKWFWPLRRMTAAYAAGKYDYEFDAFFENAPQEISKLSTTLGNMARRIGLRDDQLHEAIAVKEAAVKEIHHRVKNNLQIVSSFVRLQMRSLEPGPARQVLGNVRNRIDALSIVHQTLYQHERLEYVQMRPFFDALLEHLRGALGIEELGAQMTWDVADIERVSDDAIPMALFVLEAITNATRHVLEPQAGQLIEVTLTAEDDAMVLAIQDDGDGKSTDSDSAGLGSKLMEAFARQLSAELNEASSENGYCVELRIPHKYAEASEQKNASATVR